MAFYKSLTRDSDYQGEEFEAFATWLDKHNVKDRQPEEEEQEEEVPRN